MNAAIVATTDDLATMYYDRANRNATFGHAAAGLFQGRYGLVAVTAQLVHLRFADELVVDEFFAAYADRWDDSGRRQVARNGRLPSRQILTGAGPLEVSQPRVRDNSPEVHSRVTFSSSVLPPYLRKS
ncbi:MAG: hypothetical protein MJK04_19350, partial [Psychrosphaera sp.]|nr:hypothetical protein [Psychrosphaera sp.]